QADLMVDQHERGIVRGQGGVGLALIGHSGFLLCGTGQGQRRWTARAATATAAAPRLALECERASPSPAGYFGTVGADPDGLPLTAQSRLPPWKRSKIRKRLRKLRYSDRAPTIAYDPL